MKLNVSINAGKISQQIVVPIGDGSQSFKWLALVAANRLVRDGARHGRHLPYRSDRHSFPARTNLLPKNVYTEDCPFLHPEDIISEHVSDGDTVNVDLYMPLEFDDFGLPQLSRWAFIAFRNHERHKEQREKFAEEMKKEVERFRHETSEHARLQKIEIERPKIALMKNVMKDQFVDEELIGKVMSREWAIIKDSGILDNMVPDHDQQEEIKLFFTANFVELTDMYKFYSAVNSGGGTHTLEYIELCKFITETGILGEEHSNTILKVFLESHIRGLGGRDPKVKPSIHSEICQTEFFVALIKISIYKNITIPKKEIARLRRAGQYPSNKKATLPKVPDALKAVYKEHLVPVLTKMPAGSEMRNAVRSKEVLLVLHDNMDKLSKAFKLYVVDEEDSSSDDTDDDHSSDISKDKPCAGAITCKEFGRFAADAGFLGGNEVIRRFSVLNIGRKNSIVTKNYGSSSFGVTEKDVRQIFAASQHDLDVEEEANNKTVNDSFDADHHQELMVFSEFLEGICRLGVLKYGHIHNQDESTPKDKLSHYECIKLAIKKACSVVE